MFQVNTSKEKGEFDICKYCNIRHERDRNKCSAFGQVCTSCKKLSHFSSVSWFKNEIHIVEQVPKEVFEMGRKKSSREKIEINGIVFEMQIDTGSDLPLIHRHFWE